MDDLVNEKDSQIAGLLEEGEKLSKQQLTLNTTIKKLRARVKESEEKLKNLEEKNKKNEESLQKKTEEHNNLQVPCDFEYKYAYFEHFRLRMHEIVKP